MSLEISPQDVIKLMLQYCKENGLWKSFKALQDETHVSLNTVDSIEAFHNDIVHGRWDLVLKTVQTLKLPISKLMDLFEQIVLELIDVGDQETASLILKETFSQNGLRQEFPERTLRLEHILLSGRFDPKEAYYDMSKEKRRIQLAEKLTQEVTMVPPGRLLTLLGDLLKYQVKDGIIKPNIKYDLFTGQMPFVDEEEEAHPTKLEKTLRYGAEARIEVAGFSPNGQYLITGSVDGIMEVLDPITGKLKVDLGYQADEKFMVHTDTVTALAFSKDSELLASGSKNGQVKIWRIINGNCLKKYDQVHPGPISALLFGKDGTSVISAFHEIKIHGLKSGKQLKMFQGHNIEVTDIMINKDGHKLLSSGRDGMIKVWDYNSTECLLVFRPPGVKPGQDSDIFQIIPYPYTDKEGVPENLIVVSKNPMIHMMNTSGQVVKSFKGEKPGVMFERAFLSAKGTYLYGFADDGYVYCYAVQTGKLVHSFPIAGRYVVGGVHHPFRNILVMYNMDGDIMFYKP